jgi:Glycosyl transferase family 90
MVAGHQRRMYFGGVALDEGLKVSSSGARPIDVARAALVEAGTMATAGDHAAARRQLKEAIVRFSGELLRDHHLRVDAFATACAALDLNVMAPFINGWLGTANWFRFGMDVSDGRRSQVVRWQIDDQEYSTICFDGSPQRPALERLLAVIPLLVAYRTHTDFLEGSISINLGDVGRLPGLAFCDNRPDFFLIPDAAFLLHRGYENMRAGPRSVMPPWSARKPIAIWRGGTSGRPADPSRGWRSLPRIMLCEIARDNPEIIDAGISHVVQANCPDAEQILRGDGFIRPFMPAIEFARYRYQIDIDGNTNSWPGLFQKLLTGSPVLKIASPRGYRQWYYDRLRPWVNVVPVETDMSDLVEKITWLRDHDEIARRIGQAGQRLALSLSYDKELRAGCGTISAALRFFASAEGSSPIAAGDNQNTEIRGYQVGTHWGTTIFGDPTSGHLRHGPAWVGPSNVTVVIEGDAAHFVLTKADGTREVIRFDPEGPIAIELHNSDRFDVATFRALLDNDQGRVGFYADGLLLCAEQDGRVTLSRRLLGPWERFELHEASLPEAWEDAAETAPLECTTREMEEMTVLVQHAESGDSIARGVSPDCHSSREIGSIEPRVPDWGESEAPSGWRGGSSRPSIR